jgi:uncharacterized membrane protein
MENVQRKKTLRLVQMAVLTAIIILLAFTPLGYLKIGIVSITLLMIPVAIGAILLGPVAGLILGVVFGATSFAQCFGMDPFGTALMSINPFYTFVLCFIPRILMGFLVGLIFSALSKLIMVSTDSNNVTSARETARGFIPYIIASSSGAILNTVLFVGALILMFGNNTTVLEMFKGTNWRVIITTLITVNALVEVVVSLVVGTTVTKALAYTLGRVQTSGKSAPLA